MTGSTKFLAHHRFRQRGWSRHELEYLDRAARMLAAGGRAIESEHGLTDEGDPWYVFCDAESGEVIVHFARIGENYVCCVPFHEGALRGVMLPELVDQFLHRGEGTGAAATGVRSTPFA